MAPKVESFNVLCSFDFCIDPGHGVRSLWLLLYCLLWHVVIFDLDLLFLSLLHLAEIYIEFLRLYIISPCDLSVACFTDLPSLNLRPNFAGYTYA